MKTVCKYLFLAVLVCATGLFALSCKKETLSPEEQAKKEQEQAQKTEQFWDVVGQLVAASDIGQDYKDKDKTFEPVIGIADASNPQARIVKSNSAAAAAQSFADLVNVSTINEQTPSYTWSNPEVGTLTYTKTDGSTSWAEVEVDIPSIPHLSKIIYRSVEQSGENGSFSHAAYYRFGDVVKRTNDDHIDEYWVCVRPAFGPEGKEDSHWMCVGSLPQTNYDLYTSSHNKEYAMPTNLKSSKEHMQNFAEMLFAICKPEEWQSNVSNYSKVGWTGPSGLPIFHDFSKNNAGYHNAKFWTNVAMKWKEMGLDNLVLGRNLEYLTTDLSNSGICFLYKGYSWWWKWYNTGTLYEATFVNKPGTLHANMQTENPYCEVTSTLVCKDEPMLDVVFDVRNKKYLMSEQFFGDSRPRYIVRYAKGSDLASDGKSPAVDKAIPGVTDVYRYYKDVLPISNLKEHKPEITTSVIVNDPQKQNFRDDFTGTGHYTLGSVYKDEQGKKWIVFNIAGQGRDIKINEKNGHYLNVDCEPAPLAELISFEGMSQNNGVVSSLPTFGQAVRGATYIRHHYGEGRGAFEDPEPTKFSRLMVLHLFKHCDMNLLDMVQVTMGWGDERNRTQAFSVAYSDPTFATSQPLFRFLYPISLDNAKPPYFIWKHYPNPPLSDTKQQYGAGEFGKVPIVLQDVADKDYVGTYAPDFYAKQPLEDDPQRPRSIRTEPDEIAEFPQMYEYRRGGVWLDHLDMWNAPVLMFHMDAVYDRGGEYATTTIGGRKLTLVAELESFANPVYEDVLRDAYVDAFGRKHSNEQDWRENTFDVDGVHYNIPDWRAAWGK